MKLSKYFLSAFAFLAAIGGSIAYTTLDYAVSMGGSTIIPIAEQGLTCDRVNTGPFCLGVSAGGQSYQLFDDVTNNGSIIQSSRLRSNTGQTEVRPF